VTNDKLVRVAARGRGPQARRVHTDGVFDFREVAAQVAFAQAPNLVLVKVADAITHDTGTRADSRRKERSGGVMKSVDIRFEGLRIVPILSRYQGRASQTLEMWRARPELNRRPPA
jgi:hypothetical protein